MGPWRRDKGHCFAKSIILFLFLWTYGFRVMSSDVTFMCAFLLLFLWWRLDDRGPASWGNDCVGSDTIQ